MITTECMIVDEKVANSSNAPMAGGMGGMSGMGGMGYWWNI